MKAARSEFGWQIAVDLKADADLNEDGGPGHRIPRIVVISLIMHLPSNARFIAQQALAPRELRLARRDRYPGLASAL
jgi:hypothetical protein